MKPRQKVHSILLVSESILFISLLILSIIGCSKNPKKNEKIWICSKILTLKQILLDNMNNIFPVKQIYNISNIIKANFSEFNYQYLLEDSTKFECELNYKKCGILDSLGNIMCIPNNEDCPINEIKSYIESNGNESNYQAFIYNNENLFYTNLSTDYYVVAKLILSDKNPKYITIDNFIFDVETYKESISSSSDGGDYNDYGGDGGDYGGDNGGDNGGDIGDGFGGWRNIEEIEVIYYGNRKLTKYILEKIEEKKNLDNYYTNIHDNLYTRPYIGFENILIMNKIIKTDFRSNYKIIFPNKAAIIFGFIGLIPFIILLVFAIKRLTYKDNPGSTADYCAVCCSKIMVIFVYMVFFLAYFLYFISIYSDMKKKDINCSSIKKIKAEEFIIDFIESMCSKSDFQKKLVITEMCIFIVSFILFVIGWIVHIIVQNAIDKAKLETKNETVISQIESKADINKY